MAYGRRGRSRRRTVRRRRTSALSRVTRRVRVASVLNRVRRHFSRLRPVDNWRDRVGRQRRLFTSRHVLTPCRVDVGPSHCESDGCLQD